MVMMTREEVERLLCLFQAAEGQKWRVGEDDFCPFCGDLTLSCHQEGYQPGTCLWARVLARTGGGCEDVTQGYITWHGCTPQRLLREFLVENNLARPSKVPGEWEILVER